MNSFWGGMNSLFLRMPILICQTNICHNVTTSYTCYTFSLAGDHGAGDDDEALQQVRGELHGPAAAAAQGKKYPILYCTLHNRYCTLYN